MDLKYRVLQYIKKENMINQGDHILAGVSGGADSVCLFILLCELRRELGFELSVLHVNHKIRQEASEDAEYVRNLCNRLNVPYYIEVVDIPYISKSQSIGEEEAGRNERYKLFYQKMEEIGATKLAIAHNMNDQAETFIMNLARGSGLRGLSGIRAVRNHIIRPLLMTSREEIEDYLCSNNILFKTDSTNLEDVHTRNKIRHHILPYLSQEINAETLKHISSAAEELSLVQEYMVMQARDFISSRGIDITEHEYSNAKRAPVINLSEYRKKPYILRKYIIMELLNFVTMARKDITQAHIEDADKLCMNRNGSEEIHLPYGIRILRSYDKLQIKILDDVNQSPADTRDESVIIDSQELQKGRTYSFEYGGYNFKARLISVPSGQIEDFLLKVPRLPYTKWFDYDKILSCPTFRFRKTGDHIIVDKRGHGKSLKKFMIDEKIPEKSRDSIVVMADADDIIWVIGYRISCAYEISDRTKHILEIDALSVN